MTHGRWRWDLFLVKSTVPVTLRLLETPGLVVLDPLAKVILDLDNVLDQGLGGNAINFRKFFGNAIDAQSDTNRDFVVYMSENLLLYFRKFMSETLLHIY